jgi:Spy/CpxP family protein refolding chaperone
MKLIFALILASLAGTATAFAQSAAPLQPSPGPRNDQTAPNGPDWRQQMIARGSSAVSVDQALANLTKNLNLTPDQVARIKPILQAHHDRILKILETGPASLTRDDFTAQVHLISAQTHDQINTLLTDRQRELVKELRTPARM